MNVNWTGLKCALVKNHCAGVCWCRSLFNTARFSETGCNKTQNGFLSSTTFGLSSFLRRLTVRIPSVFFLISASFPHISFVSFSQVLCANVRMEIEQKSQNMSRAISKESAWEKLCGELSMIYWRPLMAANKWMKNESRRKTLKFMKQLD